MKVCPVCPICPDSKCYSISWQEQQEGFNHPSHYLLSF
nr:MAG TPA: hypothetical protein [Caudoviricetes sp.]